MKNLILIIFMSLSFGAFAQGPVTIKLWPNGAPNSNGITEPEQEVRKNRIGKITDPELIVFPAKDPNGMAIIACPGGGYQYVAIDHEGLNMADWFNSMGITYAVLKYRMPNGNKDVPLSDAQQAIKIMRANQDKWKFNQLGIMGSSAGGHLASSAATHFTTETRPDFQILFYPVISMSPSITHMGSHNNLLGKNPSQETEEFFSNEKQVNKQTPPAFIMHSSDDSAVPVENSINYYTALVKNGVSASLHIYPIGGHGWGFGDGFKYKRQWTGELEMWLRQIKSK